MAPSKPVASPALTGQVEVTSKDSLKYSLLVLHAILVLLVWAVFNGKESAIIATMYDSTLTAIILNLGAISGNKLIETFLGNKYGQKAS